MDKQELLQAVKSLARQGTITKDELNQAYAEGATVNLSTTEEQPTHKIGVVEILYYVGGAIVFIGIAVLINQHWSELNVAARILSTLGAGLAAFVVGILLAQSPKTGGVSQAFYLISALVTPIGIGVVLDNAGADVGASEAQTIIALVMLIGFLACLFLLRRTIFLVFSIIFGTWLVFSLTNWIVGSSPIWGGHFYEYRVLIVGLSYLLLGYSCAKNQWRNVSGWLYSAGVIGFLGAAMALGGYSPNENIFWEVFFVILVFGVIFLSVYLRSRSFLIFGAIYLMAYVLKITSEYFSQSLGWPFALIVSGLALIGIGYFAYYLNKKYIVKQIN